MLRFIQNRILYSFKRITTLWEKFVLSFVSDISGNYYTLKNIKFNIPPGLKPKLILGKGSKLENCYFYIQGRNNVVIIGDGVRLRNTTIWMEDNSQNLKIGNKTTIEGAKFFLTEDNSKITIGHGCMLSNDIEFRTGDSHTIFDNNSRQRINKPEDIFIGDRVWIGAGVRILKGVILSNETIIGTGSIVVKGNKFMSNSIYVGVPAKLVRTGICWQRDRKISSFKS
jgi:acetyltransferase-like isoleucine patch superfamily enzyme